MKKEIDAIRAKDISQGGLTQGQQTQIARNEQRMSQIMEELENLEETLNESIRESMGARSGRTSHAKKKGVTEDEEEYVSDEDEFYDRTTKKTSNRKGGDSQSIETADTLLDKKDAITKEIEEKKKLLLEEKDRMASENVATSDADALDAYMSGLSSQLVVDKTEQLQKELSSLQSDLDRILYLLKIADPSGEAARKRDSKSQEPKHSLSKAPSSVRVKQTQAEPVRKTVSEKSASGSINRQETTDVMMKLEEKQEAGEIVVDATERKTTVYTVAKPQWLGAVQNMETKETPQEAPLDMQESDQFVDYKDRKKVLENQDAAQLSVESGIEKAAPGLIIRKRKQVEKANVSETKASELLTSSSAGAEIGAEDAVALLLKHKRGYYAADDEAGLNIEDIPHGNESGKDNKKPKRVLGPERPSFLGSETDFESWVPPEGQSGDGRTSLNDRFGY
ncbi:SMAD/FHA domain-containing protein [Actinidia rufa]|uniref:SMAD/FHA domain-containing protein n=1 Tax=Actinidia rufa TaxID=165716 RepID=A0A7J0H7E5_9ERIC|nr:SMAD/FHA domain-containing protein [Actinidia rufa]